MNESINLNTKVDGAGFLERFKNEILFEKENKFERDLKLKNKIEN
jgi:hypothetical protein